MNVVVILPVLNRPHRVQPLLDSLRASEGKFPLMPLFVVSPDDHHELDEIRRCEADYLIADWPAGHGDFARKTNLAVSQTWSEWVLAGADDLVFQPNWADAAIVMAHKTNKRFVATNDRANPMVMRGKHATHPLVHRSYLDWGTIDEPGKLYCEKYSHQCVDNEATETAIARNEYVFAQNSIVEHHHPIFPRRGVKVEMDDTYRKGMAHGKEDIALLRSREHLWSEQQVAQLDRSASLRT